MLWLTDVLHVGSIEFVVQVKNFWYISRQALIGQLLLVRLGSTWTATSCHSMFGECLLHVTRPLGFLNVTGWMKQILYADDLVLMGETMEELRENFDEWREAFESKEMRVNFGNTKLLVSGMEEQTFDSNA